MTFSTGHAVSTAGQICEHTRSTFSFDRPAASYLSFVAVLRGTPRFTIINTSPPRVFLPRRNHAGGAGAFQKASTVNPLDPKPAIVKSSVNDLIDTAKSIFKTLAAAEKMNLMNAHELGGILNKIAEQCQHGGLTRALEGIGISRTRANEYRKLAKCTARDISQCVSIREAIAKFKITDSEPVTAKNDDKKPPQNGTSSSQNSGPALTIYCRAHRISAQKPPEPTKCKACIEAREEHGLPATPEAPQTAPEPEDEPTADSEPPDAAESEPEAPEREPGDDTEAIEQEKAAAKKAAANNKPRAIAEPKVVNKGYSVVVQAIDDLANVKGQKAEAERVHELARKFFKAFRDFYASVKGEPYPE